MRPGEQREKHGHMKRSGRGRGRGRRRSGERRARGAEEEDMIGEEVRFHLHDALLTTSAPRDSSASDLEVEGSDAQDRVDGLSER
eukprot:759211-Hanusia_phi.AAC.3